MAESKLTKAARATFLAQLEKGFTVTAAANAAGMAFQRFYELRDSDPEFLRAWADAYEAGTDYWRDALRRRAIEGVRDFRLDRDGNEHDLLVYSDKLLELELKRRDSSYRERQTLEVTGAGGQPFEIGVRIEHDYGEILAALEQAGVLIRGPAAAATSPP